MRKKSREEKSPCGRGRFSSSLKSADPSLPSSLHCYSFLSHISFCLSPFHLPPSPLPPSYLYPFSTNLFSISLTTSHSLSLFSPCASLSLFYSLSTSLSLSFHSFVLSLSLYSTSLILSLSQWESCRQTEAAYTNVTIFDKTHTHIHIFSCHMLNCTHTQTHGRGNTQVYMCG